MTTVKKTLSFNLIYVKFNIFIKYINFFNLNIICNVIQNELL